jgi:hypothetical protein
MSSACAAWTSSSSASTIAKQVTVEKLEEFDIPFSMSVWALSWSMTA